MPYIDPTPKAQPVAFEDLAELADLILEINGIPYNEEDLYSCAGCEILFIDRRDMDEDCHCSDCAEEAREEYKNQRGLSSYHRSITR